MEDPAETSSCTVERWSSPCPPCSTPDRGNTDNAAHRTEPNRMPGRLPHTRENPLNRVFSDPWSRIHRGTRRLSSLANRNSRHSSRSCSIHHCTGKVLSRTQTALQQRRSCTLPAKRPARRGEQSDVCCHGSLQNHHKLNGPDLRIFPILG